MTEIEMREWDGVPVSVAEYECLLQVQRIHEGIYGACMPPETSAAMRCTVRALTEATAPRETDADRIARITREMCGG